MSCSRRQRHEEVDAAGFADWEFRARAKIESQQTEEAKKSWTIRLTEGLRGPPFKVARKLGMKVIGEDGGLDLLIACIREEALPMAAEEARELYRKGSQPNGVPPRTVCNDVMEFYRNAKCLREQHPNLHEREVRQAPFGKGKSKKGGWRSGKDSYAQTPSTSSAWSSSGSSASSRFAMLAEGDSETWQEEDDWKGLFIGSEALFVGK